MEKIILFIVLLFSITVNSAIIEVNSNSGGLEDSGNCTLRSAINAAESDQVSMGCNAGSGPDTIILPNKATINFFEVDHYNVGGNALPTVFTTITIEGNDSTINRSAIAPLMRFFKVSTHFNNGTDGILTLKNMTISNGYVDGSGGAITNKSTLTLDHVKVINNHATFQGGGLSCNDSDGLCEIKNSSFINNSANYGGGIKLDFATLNIESTLIQGNFATINNGAADGGAMYVENGNYSIVNSTITENTANRYGGIFISDSPGSIDSSTIVNNNPIGIIGTTSIKNSILSNNPGGNCRVHSIVTSNGYNHSDDDSCSFSKVGDVTNIPIELMPLEYAHLYTATYPITEEGPATDKGSPNCPNFDQRGESRPQDGNNDGVFICDKGAHEKVFKIVAKQHWMIGVGDISGNNIEVSTLSTTRNGDFGIVFNPENVVTRDWGSLTLEFDECTKGTMGFISLVQEDNYNFGNGGYDIQKLATNLAGTECLQVGIENTSSKQWMSGTWYGGPSRSGEGFTIDVLSNSRAVVTWYTYLPLPNED
jgi:hypothetical protein